MSLTCRTEEESGEILTIRTECIYIEIGFENKRPIGHYWHMFTEDNRNDKMNTTQSKLRA